MLPRTAEESNRFPLFGAEAQAAPWRFESRVAKGLLDASTGEQCVHGPIHVDFQVAEPSFPMVVCTNLSMFYPL